MKLIQLCTLTVFLLIVFYSEHALARSHHKPTAEPSLDSDKNAPSVGGSPDDYIESICVNAESITRKKHQEDIDSMLTCPHQRSDVVEMLDWGFDINNDGYIDKNECEAARNFYLNWWEKPIMESCDTIFRHCDCDGDGMIDHKDIMNSVDTCIRNCDKVMLLMTYVKERVKNRKAFAK